MTNRVYKGHLARKRFGQHFLKDQCVINNIVSIINPEKNQSMVEIGPGLAALTKPVCEYVGKLTVIELDYDLVQRLKGHPFLGSKLTVYQQDALKMNFCELSKKIGQPLRIFGNLPYNISIPLIFHLFNYTDAISDINIMLQKEIVDRLVAEPNSKTYGRLSVIAQCLYKITPVLEVPPSAFIPPPTVYSMVVHLVPHKTKYPVKNIKVLNYVTTMAFRYRRKTIRNSLKNLFTINILKNLDINPTMRAENVSIEQYCRLANHTSDCNLPKKVK